MGRESSEQPGRGEKGVPGQREKLCKSTCRKEPSLTGSCLLLGGWYTVCREGRGEMVFLVGHEVQPKPSKDSVCSCPNPPTRAWAAWGPSGQSEWKINIKAEGTHRLRPGVETAERPWHFLAVWLWESHFLHVNHSFPWLHRGVGPLTSKAVLEGPNKPRRVSSWSHWPLRALENSWGPSAQKVRPSQFADNVGVSSVP